MPQFTFEGPNGQRHTIEGPEGATKEEAFKILQGHLGQPAAQAQPQTPGIAKSAASGLIQGAGAPGDLSNRALGNAPPQQPVDKDTYYGKLVDALNTARAHLELPTTKNIGDTVGMKPTEPVTTAEKVVQGGASMVPGALMGGAPTGRALMGAGSAANGVRALGLSPQGPASSVTGGAGDALQNQLLRAGLEHGANTAGHIAGIPMVGTAIKAAMKYGPKVLGFDK